MKKIFSYYKERERVANLYLQMAYMNTHDASKLNSSHE